MSGELVRLIADRLAESGQVKHLLASAYLEPVAQAASLVVETLRAGRSVLLFGNGGSAADAQHIAAEFVGRYVEDRPALPAVALTTDSSALTAIGNDYGFEQVFARQVRALGRPGDLAIGISTSGTSANVNAGLAAARELGLRTIGLAGRGGGELARIAEVCIVVPSRVTARIQEAHIAVGHILCELVDRELFGIAQPVRGRGYAAPKVVDRATLVALRQAWAEQHRTVVWTNGCFDVVHIGHVQSLEAARQFGDVLVVGINGDSSVTALKGPGRPLVPADERAALIAALECVDWVVVFDELTPEAILAELRPDVHCKGADYAASGKVLPERAIVEGYGGRVEFLPYVPNRSTTALVERLRGAGGGVDGAARA